jgi:hypothetical protein
MADNIPVTASGPREPVKRPRPIPKLIRAAITMMVCGADTIDGAPMDLVEAAKSVGIRPDTLRRYLGRPAVIALLRAERKTFREEVLAGTEHALRSVRDGKAHQNPMARVAAARALSQIDETETASRSSVSGISMPGMTIVIVNASPAPRPDGILVDVTPVDKTGGPDEI